MNEIFETFGTYLARIEKIGDKLDKPILLSTDVESEILTDWDNLKIRKKPILWPLYTKNMFYEVTVPAGTKIPKHSHDEAIFRYVIDGSFVINGEYKVSAGMWCVINENVPYEITTESGYKALSAYTSKCQTHRGIEAKQSHRLEK